MKLSFRISVVVFALLLPLLGLFIAHPIQAGGTSKPLPATSPVITTQQPRPITLPPVPVTPPRK